MRTLFNSLKAAAAYTVAFILIYTAALWFVLFLLVTIQVFWKAFVTLFLVAFAIFTWDAYSCTERLKDIWSRRSYAARFKYGVDRAMDRYSSVM
jgi:hypothetical protein